MKKKIEKLTPEQDAKLAEYAEKGIAIGLCCDPIDEDAARDYGRRLMEYLKRDYIGTVIVDSPLAASRAVRRLSAVEHLLDPESSSGVWDGVAKALSAELYRLGDRVRWEMTDSIREHFGEQADARITDVMFRLVRMGIDGVEDAVRSETLRRAREPAGEPPGAGEDAERPLIDRLNRALNQALDAVYRSSGQDVWSDSYARVVDAGKLALRSAEEALKGQLAVESSEDVDIPERSFTDRASEALDPVWNEALNGVSNNIGNKAWIDVHSRIVAAVRGALREAVEQLKSRVAEEGSSEGGVDPEWRLVDRMSEAIVPVWDALMIGAGEDARAKAHDLVMCAVAGALDQVKRRVAERVHEQAEDRYDDQVAGRLRTDDALEEAVGRMDGCAEGRLLEEIGNRVQERLRDAVIKLRIQVNEQSGKRADGQLRSAESNLSRLAALTADQADERLDGFIDEKIWDSLAGAVMVSVLDQAGRQVRDQVDGSTGRKVYPALQNAEAAAVEALPADADRRIWESVLTSVFLHTAVAVVDAVVDAVTEQLGEREAGKGDKAPERAAWPYLDGQFWAHFVVWHRYLVEVLGLELPSIWQYEDQVQFGPVYPLSRFVVISRRPECVHRDANGNLHCENGPAIRYPDGFSVYSLHGVRVPEWLVMKSESEIDPAEFAKIENVEIRREFVRKVGIERIVAKTGAVALDAAGDYELLSVNLGGTTGECSCLKMINPSTGTYHMEFVPPDVDTVEKALRWRNQSDLKPSQLT